MRCTPAKVFLALPNSIEDEGDDEEEDEEGAWRLEEEEVVMEGEESSRAPCDACGWDTGPYDIGIV